MGTVYPVASVGDVATTVKRAEAVDPAVIYRQIGVRLWGEGAYEREPISGTETRYKELYRVEEDDIIANKIWARNGSVAVVPAELAGCYGSSEFPTFEPNRQRLEPRWFHWITKTKFFWGQCDEKSHGTSGKNRIRPERFLEIEIPLPPLAEQRRIVARIEELAAKVEAARALRQEAVKETEVLVSSMLSHLFDYQPSDMLPAGWAWRSFRDLLFDRKEGMKTGPFGTLLQKSDVQSEGVPILGIVNVQANRFVPGFTDYVSWQKAEQLSSYRLQEDDIVVARSGTVGRSCVVPSGLDPAPVMSTNLIRLRLNASRFLPELLCHLFNGSRLIEYHKESECRGSTRSFFTQKILSRLQVPVPPLSEQRRIVAYLDDLQARVDAVKQHQAATAAALNALLPSILDQAFKGEL